MSSNHSFSSGPESSKRSQQSNSNKMAHPQKPTSENNFSQQVNYTKQQKHLINQKMSASEQHRQSVSLRGSASENSKASARRQSRHSSNIQHQQQQQLFYKHQDQYEVESIQQFQQVQEHQEPQVAEEQQTSWDSLESLFWDHLDEVEAKWSTLKLNDDIWAKLIYFERNKRLAKAYVSAPVLTIDGSTQGLDGFRIGLSGIENSARTLDSMACLRSIGRGIRLRIDSHGNIIMRRNSNSQPLDNNNRSTTIAQHHQTSDSSANGSSSASASQQAPIGSVKLRSWLRSQMGANGPDLKRRVQPTDCFVSELSAGQAIKLFDMQKFRLNLQPTGEMQQSPPDWRQCVNLISFMKPQPSSKVSPDAHLDSSDPLQDSCWIMIINIIAIDMLKSSQQHQQQQQLDLLYDPRASIMANHQLQENEPRDHYYKGAMMMLDDDDIYSFNASASANGSQARQARSSSRAWTTVRQTGGQLNSANSSTSTSSHNLSNGNSMIVQHEQTHKISRISTQEGLVAPPGGLGGRQPAISSLGRTQHPHLRTLNRDSQLQQQQYHQQRPPRVALLAKSSSQQHLNGPTTLASINQSRLAQTPTKSSFKANQTIYTTFNYNRFNRGGAIHANDDGVHDNAQQMINTPIDKRGRQVELAAIRMGKLSLSSFELSNGMSQQAASIQQRKALFNSGAILMNYEDDAGEQSMDEDEQVAGEPTTSLNEPGDNEKISENIKNKEKENDLKTLPINEDDQNSTSDGKDNLQQQTQSKTKTNQELPRKQKISRASLDSSGASSRSSHSAGSTTCSSGCADASCQDDHFPFLAAERNQATGSSCFSLTSSSQSARSSSPSGGLEKKQQQHDNDNSAVTQNNNNIMNISNLNKKTMPAHETTTSTSTKQTTSQRTKISTKIAESQQHNCSSSSGLSSCSYSALTNDSTGHQRKSRQGAFRNEETIPRALRLSKKVTCIGRPAKANLERGLSSSETSLSLLQDVADDQDELNYVIGSSNNCALCSCIENEKLNFQNNKISMRAKTHLKRRSQSASKYRADLEHHHLPGLECTLCSGNNSCCDLATSRHARTISASISNSGSSPSSAASSSSHSPPSIPMRNADSRDLRKRFNLRKHSSSKNLLFHKSQNEAQQTGCCSNPMSESSTNIYDINISQYHKSSERIAALEAVKNNNNSDLNLQDQFNSTQSSQANLSKLVRKKKYANLLSRFIQPFGSSNHQQQQQLK